MTVKPVDVQSVSLAIEVQCWQVIWQGWPHLRAEFKNARFRQSRKHGICRSQQFESSTNGNRGAIFALDAGCADDEPSFRARNDVYGVARMQKPQHVMQFDLGRVQAHDLPRTPRSCGQLYLAPMPRQSTTIPASGVASSATKFSSDTRLQNLRERWRPP